MWPEILLKPLDIRKKKSWWNRGIRPVDLGEAFGTAKKFDPPKHPMCGFQQYWYSGMTKEWKKKKNDSNK